MAEDEVVEAEGAEEEVAQSKPPKDMTKIMLISLMSLAILLMILTPIMTVLYFNQMVPKMSEDESSTSEVEKVYEYVIPKVQCNLSGSQGTKYIRLDIAFTYNKPDMKFFFDAPPKEGEENPGKPESLRNRILAKLIMIISSKQVNDLESVEDKEKLANDIKDSLNEIIKDERERYKMEDATVLDVYFPNFLIQ
jgi:flagellar basal body-associated protein FliL